MRSWARGNDREALVHHVVACELWEKNLRNHYYKAASHHKIATIHLKLADRPSAM